MSQPKRPPNFTKSQKWITIGFFAGFITLCIVLLMFVDPPEEEPASDEAGQQAPTPTLAPKPVVTATVCPTAEERSYTTFVGNQLETLGVYSTKLGNLFTELSNDILLAYDLDWKIDAAVVLNEQQIVAIALLERQAPTSMNAIESKVHQIGDLVLASTRLYVEGLDDMDDIKMERATGLVEEATTLILQLPAEFSSFCGN